ncbi:hypothetical protein JHK82_045223 [Glycine max]|nr:hypothetical protein JHK82_045223 [Glycine max]
MFGDKINQHASKCGTSRNVLSRYAMHLIYRVPPDIRETNLKAYTPRIVSIGPIHKARYAGNEDSIFESMEELKVNYLKAFLYRTQIPMGTFIQLLAGKGPCVAKPMDANANLERLDRKSTSFLQIS